MNRQDAERYVSFIADDALSFREPGGEDCDVPTEFDWLIGWQCGFEPLFVRVRSYLPQIQLDEDEAIGLAISGLQARSWFADRNDTTPTYTIAPRSLGGAL